MSDMAAECENPACTNPLSHSPQGPHDAREQVGQYGFTWGPMEVTRIASYFPRGLARGKYHILGVKTPKASVEVCVSPTGLVRVFKNGEEIK